MSKFYNQKYSTPELYWGNQPSTIARLLFMMYPPQEGKAFWILAVERVGTRSSLLAMDIG